jgi:hypothetical protein
MLPHSLDPHICQASSLVSRAICESAKEQFICLLPLSIIDTQMPDDAALIQHSWDTTAARWRFKAHRRNILLCALTASSVDNDLLSQLGNRLVLFNRLCVDRTKT